MRAAHRRLRTALEFHTVQALLARNRELRGFRGNRERCFILGTGPSINKQDVSLLRGETVFAVNSFYLHPQYDYIDPAFHCGADLGVGVDAPNVVAHLQDMERAAKRATFILPTDAAAIIRKYGLFKNRQVYYVFYSEPGLERGRVRADLTRPVSTAGSVSLACLILACYMGFPKIYLLGCDHDWLASPTVVTHFYGDHEPHFENDTPLYTYEEMMEGTLRLWQSYRIMRTHAVRRGIEIYNATEGGYLDVFPRVKYETLMAGKRGQGGAQESVGERDRRAPV